MAPGLPYRQAWAFFLAKMLTDPVWWFYLYWLNYYLIKDRGVSAKTASLMVLLPYCTATVGSVFGGWLSGSLIQRGWPVGKARLGAMGIFALGMPAAIGALFTGNVWVALSLLSVATACHQAWSANVFTLSSDLFPRHVVGAVVGFGSMCGSIGGMFMTVIAGGTLQWFGSFVPLLCIAGVMHLSAWAVATAASAGLRRGGMIVMLGGVGLSILVSVNFRFIQDSAKSLSTALGGLAAAILVFLIGVALTFASRARPA